MSVPSVADLQRYFEDREAEIRRKKLQPDDEWRALEAVHHEAVTVDILLGVLPGLGVRIQMDMDDLNPIVEDLDGTPCEIA